MLDWRRKQQSQAAVRLCIETELDKGLPPACTLDLYRRKCDRRYQHI